MKGAPPSMNYGRRGHLAVNVLPTGANPVECGELKVEEEVERCRKTLCVHQTACVTFAASQNWNGYHCLNCAVEKRLSVDEQRLDLEGLADFLACIC